MSGAVFLLPVQMSVLGSPGSRRRSTAILIARSRSSSGYFLGAAMTLILSWNESLHQTRHGTVRTSEGISEGHQVNASVRAIES